VVGEVSVDDGLRLRARDESERAAARAGVEVRLLTEISELDAARRLWDVVWDTTPGETEMTPAVMRALIHAGSYVAGAYDGDDLVASALGFVARRQREDGSWHVHLHSHVAAALPAYSGRGIGTALKVHQRAWALDHDLDRIEWTFDPLVRRNARLNVVKLGGTASEYLVDFYGQMLDSVNSDDRSDRLVLAWDLASDRVAAALAGERELPSRAGLLALGAEPAVVEGADGAPVPNDVTSPVRLVAVPADIVAVRASDPGLARAWRDAMRDALEPVLAAGGRVVGLTAEGEYVVEAQQ
jgi:predicted GNAT superfamily acetyltransferase